MNGNYIGSLISNLRKQKGYTQQELAEKLIITEKDISLWETGQELPDATIHKQLSEILGNSFDDAIAGNKVDLKFDSIKYLGRMSNIIINIIFVLIGCGLLLLPIFKGTINNQYYYVYGGFFIILAILRMVFNHQKIITANSYRALYSFVLLSQVTALLLELFSESLVMPFSDGPNKYIYETFSYFSLIPPAYAECSPILTGILTIVVVVLSIIIIIKTSKIEKLRNTNFICSILAFIFSILLFWENGIDYMSIPNYAVSILILLSCILQIVANRRIKSN